MSRNKNDNQVEGSNWQAIAVQSSGFDYCAAILFVVVRLAYAPLRQLAPDEAYYWVWSRHLAGGYLDHPPMVAWLIHAGTWLVGSTELGVRLGAALMGGGVVWMLLRWLRQWSANSVLWGAILLLSAPLLAVLGTIHTPDTPAAFFSVAALFALLGAANQPVDANQPIDGRRWMTFGLCVGLAFCSKYTTILLPAAVGLALLFDPRGRAELRRPWPYIAGLLAALVFAPVLYWNARHDWVSFRFQMAHGFSSDQRAWWIGLGEYLGGQAATYTPILFALAIGALIHYAAKWRRVDLGHKILFCAAVLPLLFFAYSSTHRRVEVNWPSFAWLPITVLLAEQIAGRPRWRSWATAGVVIALVSTLALHFPDTLARLSPAAGKLDDLTGWRQLAAKVDGLRGDARVYANTYQDASELSFYLRGQPDVWTLQGLEGRPNAFAYFDKQRDWRALDRLVFVTKYSADALAADFPYRDEVNWSLRSGGRELRRRWIVFCSKTAGAGR